MTENTKIYSIEDVNNKIKEYYEQIKLSGKNQDDFILDDFKKEFEEIFSKIPKIEKIIDSSDNEIDFSSLFEIKPDDIVRRINIDLKIIENGIKQIVEGYNKKEEIFLDFDLSNIKEGIITLDDFDGYFGGYYLLLLKILLILWKNEINLLDESMSFHHINKSKLDIKNIYKILKDEKGLEKGKKILEDIFEYSKYLLFKFNILDKDEKIDDKYKEYLDLISFNDKCYDFEEYKKEDDKKVIENILKEIIGEDKFKLILKEEIEILDDKELYLIFRYIKDVKYINNNIKAYNTLKNILNKYLEGKTDFYKDGNIVFFINNLISLLNKSIENNNNDNDTTFQYDDELKYIDNLFIDKDLKETYFTYLKKSQLYKNLGKLKESNNLFKEASNYIDESIDLFEKNDGAYFPFMASSDLIKSNGIFSYSTFIKSSKTDYYLKIKKEQLSISEFKSEYRIKLKEKEIDDKMKQSQTIIEDKIIKNQADIEDKFHNNNIKTIEILAVFSAIVLFVSSSIQVFQYLPNISSIIYVIVGFGFSLILFISLIFFLISNEKNYYKYGYVYGILFLMIILFIVISLNIKNENVLINKEYQDKTKEEIIKDLKNNSELNNSYIDLINSKYNSIEFKNKEYQNEINNKIEKIKKE